MPDATTIPISNREPEPGHAANNNGTIANTKDTVVINTGRSLIAAASSIALNLECLFCCNLLANSTIKIPCFDITPIKVINPT